MKELKDLHFPHNIFAIGALMTTNPRADRHECTREKNSKYTISDQHSDFVPLIKPQLCAYLMLPHHAYLICFNAQVTWIPMRTHRKGDSFMCCTLRLKGSRWGFFRHSDKLFWSYPDTVCQPLLLSIHCSVVLDIAPPCSLQIQSNTLRLVGGGLRSINPL